MDKQTKSVFISHASVDAELAADMCAFLESKGLPCWYAPREIGGGADFAAAIIDGVEQCRVMLLLVTPTSSDSPHVLREVNHAIARKMHILPVRLLDFTLPKSMAYYLSHVQWINAFPGEPSEFYADIHGTLVALLERREPPKRPVGCPPERGVASNWRRQARLALVVLALSLVAGLGVWQAYERSLDLGSGVPSSRRLGAAEIGTLKALATGLVNGLAWVDLTLVQVDDTTRKALDYYDSVLRSGPNPARRDELLAWVAHEREKLANARFASPWDAGLLREFPEERYHMIDMQAFFEVVFDMHRKEVEGFLDSTESFARTPPEGWLDEQRRVLELRRDILMESGRWLYFGAAEIFADYPAEAVAELDPILNECSHLPIAQRPDAKLAASLCAAAMRQMEKKTLDLAVLVGNGAKALAELHGAAGLPFHAAIAAELLDQIQCIDSHLIRLGGVWNEAEKARILAIWDGSDGGANQSRQRKQTDTRIWADSMVDSLSQEFTTAVVKRQVPAAVVSIAAENPDLTRSLSRIYDENRALAEREQAVVERLKALALCASPEDVRKQCLAVDHALRTVQLQAESTYLGMLRILVLMSPDAKQREQVNATLAALAKLDPKGLPAIAVIDERLLAIMAERQALVAAKRDDVAATRNRLADVEMRLAASYDRIREKCTLGPADDPGLMWGKIMRLMAVGLYDDAEAAMDRYLELNRERDPDAPAIMAAAKAYLARKRTDGIDHGALVFAIENDARHSTLKPGDIVIELDGERVLGADSYFDIKQRRTDNGETPRTYAFLRVTPDGSFRRVDAAYQPDDPRVGLADLTENLDE